MIVFHETRLLGSCDWELYHAKDTRHLLPDQTRFDFESANDAKFLGRSFLVALDFQPGFARACLSCCEVGTPMN
jgi:hypothetical protein